MKERYMDKKRVFISFDYDHDVAIKELLVGHAKNEASAFSISDWSIKEESVTWKAEAAERIKRSDVVIVLCGENTDCARGVGIELELTQQLDRPYFLLAGYSDKTCRRPITAKATDKMYRWTWTNLKLLLEGNR